MYITAAGITELQQKLTNLRHIRERIVTEMRDLTTQSSTAGVEDVGQILHQGRISELEAQIHHIEYALGTATVVPHPARNTIVQIGSAVTIQLNGTPRTYSIVSSLEADPEAGKISNESPLGKALIGKKAHDQFTFSSGSATAHVITITAIN